MSLNNIKTSGTASVNTLTGLTLSIGLSDHYVLIGTTLRSDDREVAYVWSTEHQYAGCPDLIGEIGGVRVIADFKTSNAPYCSNFPERGDRIGFGGFRKYTKCAQQLSAYRLALEERTGYHCDVALIIVSTPETSQAIFIDGDQLALQESRFIKRAEQFHAYCR